MAALAAVAAWALLPGVAAAGDKAAATLLFEEGVRLLDEGRVDEACPTLVASLEAYPSPGAMLNLARCHREQGKNATAWSEYAHAAEMFDKFGNPERAAFSRAQTEALRPLLSHLTVSVPSPVDGLRVLRDGTEVGRGAYGVAVPVDPGSHRVEARAPGHVPWSTTVVVGSGGAAQRVQVPALERTRQNEPSRPPLSPARPTEGADPMGYYIGAGVAGAVGVAGLVLGGIYGVRASSDWDAAREQCPEGGSRCTEQGASLSKDAQGSATVSTVGFVVGGVGVAAAVLLAVLAPSAAASDEATGAWMGPVQIAAASSPGGVTVLGRGRF